MSIQESMIEAVSDRFEVVDRWRAYISDCAAQYSGGYDERQDLISDAVRALLEYDKPIEHPRSFIWTTVRRLAINRGSVGAGARELSNADDVIDAEIEDAELPFSETVILRDTLERLLSRLTRAELTCYDLLKLGYEQRDLPGLMGISRQAVSKLMNAIRRKYENLEAEDLL